MLLSSVCPAKPSAKFVYAFVPWKVPTWGLEESALRSDVTQDESSTLQDNATKHRLRTTATSRAV